MRVPQEFADLLQGEGLPVVLRQRPMQCQPKAGKHANGAVSLNWKWVGNMHVAVMMACMLIPQHTHANPQGVAHERHASLFFILSLDLGYGKEMGVL